MGPRGPRWPIYAPIKWVEKKDGCPFLFLFVHKLVRQSLSVHLSIFAKTNENRFHAFCLFLEKGGGGGGHPWVTVDCPEN